MQRAGDVPDQNYDIVKSLENLQYAQEEALKQYPGDTEPLNHMFMYVDRNKVFRFHIKNTWQIIRFFQKFFYRMNLISARQIQTSIRSVPQTENARQLASAVSKIADRIISKETGQPAAAFAIIAPVPRKAALVLPLEL